MESAIDTWRSFFLNGKQCIPFSYTVSSLKGDVKDICQKLKKVIFKLKHGKSCQYVILRTTQSILKISNNTENKKQFSSFYLSSQRQLARNVGYGEIRISIAWASQIITVFPYNIQAPYKILGVPGLKMFRMPWIMTQKQISQKAFLAKCYYRKRGGMAPMLPSPSFVEEPDIYIYNIYIYVYIYIYIYIYISGPGQNKALFLEFLECKVVLAIYLENFRTKDQVHLKFQYFFLISPENSTFFLTNLWKFCILFLRYP